MTQNKTSNQIRALTTKAKRVGKEINKYSDMLSMVPYANPAIRGANLAIRAADSLAELMDSFSFQSSPALVGGPASGYAGVSNNVSVRNSAPKFRGGKGVIRITHKELIATVPGSVSLGTSTRSSSGPSVFQVNAGCGTTFPWLSQIAANYEYYKFKRLRFVYVPMAATSEPGRMSLLYDPDSSDAIPLDKQALSNYSCRSEGAPWATQFLDCDLAGVNGSNWYYVDNVSSGSNTTTATNALVDQGQFFFVTYGNITTTGVGEIYALYDVEFKEPQPNASQVAQVGGTAPTVFSSVLPSNFPVFSGTNTANSIVFTVASAGRYLFTISCVSTAASNPTVSTGGTISNNILNNGSATQGVSVVVVTDPSVTVTFGGLTGLAAWTIYITRLPYYSTPFF